MGLTGGVMGAFTSRSIPAIRSAAGPEPASTNHGVAFLRDKSTLWSEIKKERYIPKSSVINNIQCFKETECTRFKSVTYLIDTVSLAKMTVFICDL